jgi:acetyl-CoA C-acetyltransferase
MSDRIAIVASKKTPFGNYTDTTREYMNYDLVKSLYKEVGITRHGVDTFVMAANDFFDGRTISECFIVPRIGAYMKDETKVEMDGLNAVIYGAMRIMSGNYETALVVAHSLSASEFKPMLVKDFELDPVYERQLGLINDISAAALQARAYMLKYGLTEEDIAKVAAKSLSNASLNPCAMYRNHAVTVADVMASKQLYSPIRQLMMGLYADGAVAVLLASEKAAKKLTDKPVWIKGMAQFQDSYYIGERDLVKCPQVRKAAAAAYKMAGIVNPKKQIQLAEISSNYAHQEIVFGEALGLFSDGSGKKVAREGLSALGGEIAVNPSGGPLGAYLLGANGLIRLAEAAEQLRGEAGLLQVAGAKNAVVQSQDGLCAQQSAVVVLGK